MQCQSDSLSAVIAVFTSSRQSADSKASKGGRCLSEVGREGTGDLYDVCKAVRDDRFGDEWIFCIAYFRGFFDMALIDMKNLEAAQDVVASLDPSGAFKGYLNGRPICPDIESIINMGQLVQIFVNWAESNPTKWAEPVMLGAYQALKEAYPCN